MSQGTQEAYATLRAQIEELANANTALGAQIDAIRDQRRALKDQIIALEEQCAVLLAAEQNPLVLNAIVPGATVEVSGAELLQLMATALNKG